MAPSLCGPEPGVDTGKHERAPDHLEILLDSYEDCGNPDLIGYTLDEGRIELWEGKEAKDWHGAEYERSFAPMLLIIIHD